MKKKLLLLLMFSVSCALACFGITACSGEPEHEHSFTETATADCLASAATCATKATYYKSCACGEKGTETFEYGSLAEHTYGTWIAEEPATETATGTKGHYHCSVCEKNFDNNHSVIDSISIPKVEHNHSYVQTVAADDHLVSEATCTAKAVYYKSCACGANGTETFEYGEPLGHTYGTLLEEVPATCVKEGKVEHYHCSVCEKDFDADKQELESIITPIDENNHNYINGICSACEALKLSDGLSYTLLSDGSYAVSGIGTCTDENIVIPSVYNDASVTSIRSRAFYNCSSINSVVIPDSVTSIDYYAFSNCTNLTSVITGNGVIKIEEEAFSNCRGLESITIGNSVTSIGSYAFYTCTSLTSIVIPDGVTSIGSSAFSGCSGLTSITIGNGVTDIDSGAFNGCSSLTYNEQDNACYLGNSENMYLWLVKAKSTDITSCAINPNCKFIFINAFSQCYVLENIYITDLAAWCNINGAEWIASGRNKNLYLNNELITDLVIPDGVTSISENAFALFVNITSVVVPDSVTSMGMSAFSGCSNITSVTIGKSVTCIPRGAFYECRALRNIVIPNGVTNIGEDAFRGCSSITSIAIPDGVTSIGSYAFGYCDSLTSVTLSNAITTIEVGTFRRCSSLKSVVIPDGVTSIGNYAFYDCGALRTVVIPKSVTSIGNYAFYDCEKLSEVNYTGTQEELNNISFGYYWNTGAGKYTINYNYKEN